MKKGILWLLMLALLSLSACAVAAEPVKVMTLKGPTGIGMVQMIAAEGGAYEISLAGSPDEIVAAIASGSVDIAAAPTNLAAVLYNKTGGNVRLLALNTLGVLHILEKGEEIKDVSDLAGKTIYTSGQGAMPEYVLRYILEQFSVEATLEFKTEHSELTTLAASGMADLVMLPEPFATTLLSQNKEFRRALDVTELFAKAADKAGEEGTVLSMGCIIARADFVKAHPDKVEAFLKDYAASVAFVQEKPEEASQLVEKTGIMPSANVALAAMPGCNIVFVAGEAMKSQVSPMFAMLFAANPASVGGKLPADDFYHVAP